MLKGIIFDMDGVLLDSEPFIIAAAQKMFAEKGFTDVKPEDFHPFTGTGEDRFIGGVAEKHGCELNMPEDKNRTYQIYLELIKGQLKPLNGTAEFIQNCRAKGLKLAIASSADSVKVVGNLREIDIPAETFDAVVTGSDVANKKPAPDIFIKAARQMGLDPADCLVIEDAPSGIAAGNSAGARTLAITSSFDKDKLSQADYFAPDLANVPPNALSEI